MKALIAIIISSCLSIVGSAQVGLQIPKDQSKLRPPASHCMTSPDASIESQLLLQHPFKYKVKDLALFCRLEVKIEKQIKMPFRFRLGSVDYVDYLEGKRRNYSY